MVCTVWCTAWWAGLRLGVRSVRQALPLIWRMVRVLDYCMALSPAKFGIKVHQGSRLECPRPNFLLMALFRRFSWNCEACEVDICNKCLQETRSTWASTISTIDPLSEGINLSGEWTVVYKPASSGNSAPPSRCQVGASSHPPSRNSVMGWQPRALTRSTAVLTRRIGPRRGHSPRDDEAQNVGSNGGSDG